MNNLDIKLIWEGVNAYIRVKKETTNVKLVNLLVAHNS